jgi:hypothetical protein
MLGGAAGFRDNLDESNNWGPDTMTHAKSLRRGILAAAILTAIGTITPAAAQGTIAQREACEGDAFKFCSNFIPMVHAIENCLYRNMRNLTPACRVQMQGGATNVSTRRR